MKHIFLILFSLQVYASNDFDGVKIYKEFSELMKNELPDEFYKIKRVEKTNNGQNKEITLYFDTVNCEENIYQKTLLCDEFGFCAIDVKFQLCI